MAHQKALNEESFFYLQKTKAYFDTMVEVQRVFIPPDVVQEYDKIHQMLFPEHPPVNWFCGACVESAMRNLYNTYNAQADGHITG
jgi:hypothetical protein